MIPGITLRKGNGDEWLVVPNDTDHVQTAICIDGDTYHIGLSLKVTPGDPDVGEPVTFPDIVQLAIRCAEGVQAVLDEYPDA